jgi:hypothetical protein
MTTHNHALSPSVNAGGLFFESAKSISATKCLLVFKPYKHHISNVRFSP